MRRAAVAGLSICCALLSACAKPQAVVFEGPMYISPDALAAFEEMSEGMAPDDCHLEVIQEEGKVIYQCSGTCPGNQSCNLQIKKEGNRTRIFCDCD